LLGEEAAIYEKPALLAPGRTGRDVTDEIQRRKLDHLELCASGEVDFRNKTTLLECVRLVHCATPELSVADVDLRVHVFGKTLRAPLLIAAMTGGADDAGVINRDLAAVAESLGLAFGLGSQRAMHLHPEKTWTYQVREAAPHVLLFGNIGAVQAREMSVSRLAELCDAVGADALCLHLNPAMEVVQPGGDDDFRGVLETIQRVAAHLGRPVIAKETGCGFSRDVAGKLVAAGCAGIDVSGAGGTSWVGVETKRASGGAAELGAELWDWGIPTAASITFCVSAAPISFPVIATGGLRSGMDVARAIALGASVAGLAAPVLRAYREGGREGAKRFLEGVIHSLRTVMLLTGCRTLAELRRAPRVVVGELTSWLELSR